MKTKILSLIFGIIILGLIVNVSADWDSDLNDGLIGYWSFDGAEDSVTHSADLVRGLYNFSNVGDPEFRTGINGNGTYLDGNDLWRGGDWLEFEESGTNWSLSFWVNASSYKDLYTKYDGANVGYSIQTPETANNISFSSGSVVLTDEASANVWYHVVLLRTTDGTYIYLNGALNGSNAGYDVESEATSHDLCLGGECAASNTDFTTGVFDEVGVWNRTLTTSEISILYNGGLGVTYNENIDLDPSVTLTSPINYYNTSSNSISFDYECEDDFMVENMTFYIDGVVNTTTIDGVDNITTASFSFNFIDGDYNWKVSCWDNKTQQTNSSLRYFTIDQVDPSVSASVVYSDYHVSEDNITLNWTISDAGVGLDDCWYEYEDSNITVTCSDTGTYIAYRNYTNNNLILWANDSIGNINSDSVNWDVKVFENSLTYNSTVTETSLESFYLNVTQVNSTIDIFSAALIFNGTSYSATKSESGDYNIFLKSLNIPSPPTYPYNYSFIWNITLSNIDSGVLSYVQSNYYNQTVDQLKFGLCSDTLNISLLNFTLVDEITEVEINGSSNTTTFQAFFQYGSNPALKTNNYTINNQSTNITQFNLCTNSETNIIYIDMEAFYSAVDYADSDYFLNNATLTNTTSLVNLYLLEDTSAVEFFINVEENLLPIDEVTVSIAKYFVSEGAYKTVEIDETDVDGQITAYLDLDKKYRFTLTKDGDVLGIFDKKATCEAAPCEIDLAITDSATDLFSLIDSLYAQNVLYNISFNPNTQMVTFDFIDTTGLSTYFRMSIYQQYTNQSNVLIYNKTLYTSSGSMEYNMTGYEGDFKVETFVSRSPEKLIDWIAFIISDITGDLGLLGLFTAFIFVMVVIFGLAYQPSMLVFAVPLGLTMAKLMGIVSLSGVFLVVLYVLGGLAIVVMNR